MIQLQFWVNISIAIILSLFFYSTRSKLNNLGFIAIALLLDLTFLFLFDTKSDTVGYVGLVKWLNRFLVRC